MPGMGMVPFMGAAAGNAMAGYQQGQQQNQMMDIQKQKLGIEQEGLQQEKAKGFLTSFITMLDHTPDADIPALTQQFNSVAPKFGLPPISNLQRKSANEYQWIDVNGHLIRGDKQSGKIEDTGIAGTPEKPLAVSADTTLLDPTTKQPIYTAPHKQPTMEPQLKQTADGRYVWITPPQTGATPSVPSSSAQPGAQPAATPGGSSVTNAPSAVQPNATPPVKSMIPGVENAPPSQPQPAVQSNQQPVGMIDTGLRGPASEKSEYQTFAEGRRDTLVKQGWTDEGAINRDVASEWQKRKVELESSKLDTKSKEIDIPSMAEAVANNQDSANNIRGSMGNPVSSKVKTEVLKKYPKFDFNKSEANATWQKSPQNQKIISQVEGILPRMQALEDQVSSLKNADFNLLNRAMNAVNKEFGKPEVTNFESNRNAIVQEVGTALSGSSTGSDLRIKLELENMKASQSPEQIMGAIHNLNEALLSRLDTQLSVPYPIEVVRGEVSPEDYRKSMRTEYTIGGKATQQPQNDLSHMSDADLLNALGVK